MIPQSSYVVQTKAVVRKKKSLQLGYRIIVTDDIFSPSSTNNADTDFSILRSISLHVSGYSPNTKFTKTPPSTVYGVLGRHVYFRWKFSFADSKDRSDFESVIWGETNTRNRIVDKYITVFPDGRWEVNPTLKPKLKARLAVSVVNITQSECNVEFVLKNVVKEDTQPTYGCEVKIFLDEKKDGPIQLAMAGKIQFTNQFRYFFLLVKRYLSTL